MLWSEHLLLDVQGALIERLGLSIASSVVEVQSRLVEQLCCFGETKPIGINEGCPNLRMHAIRFTRGQVPFFHCGKSEMECADHPFCPLALCFSRHIVLEDGLHESVDTQGVCLGITSDERILPHDAKSIVELPGIFCDWPQNRTQDSCSFTEQRFWNGIRSKKGTHFQKFGSGRVGFFDGVEGKRPGGSHWFRMRRG